MAGSNWFQTVAFEEGIVKLVSWYKNTSKTDSIIAYLYYQI